MSPTSLPLEGLSVCIPCYNEQDNIDRVLGELVTVLTPLASVLEVVVVNDGSTDGTETVVKRRLAQDPRIRLISHPHNQGYGAALASGFKNARQPWIFLMDGDGQFNPGQLRDCLEDAPTVDAILGYRVGRQESVWRRLNGWAWSRLVGLLFGFRTHDVDCAFKLFKRSLLGGYTFQANGAFFSTELLVLLKNRGARWIQAPVSHRPRVAGSPTGARLDVIARAFRELFRFWWRLRRSKGSL